EVVRDPLLDGGQLHGGVPRVEYLGAVGGEVAQDPLVELGRRLAEHLDPVALLHHHHARIDGGGLRLGPTRHPIGDRAERLLVRRLGRTVDEHGRRRGGGGATRGPHHTVHGHARYGGTRPRIARRSDVRRAGRAAAGQREATEYGSGQTSHGVPSRVGAVWDSDASRDILVPGDGVATLLPRSRISWRIRRTRFPPDPRASPRSVAPVVLCG